MPTAAPWQALTRIGVAAMAALAVTSSGVAGAARPAFVAYPIDVTFPIPELTAGCGFDVSFSIVGTFKGTIFYDSSGAIVRELDTQPATQIIWSSSTTGKSFTYKFSTVFRTDFVNGTAPGSRAIATITGFGDKTPGVPAAAGRIVLGATVLFVDSDGVPIVDYDGPVISSHGRMNDPEVNDAAICAALAP